ncbi:hypothetical protein TTHERM_00245520 (macronuclear) [Tetrahymena thermophila SB210]|uniref:Uncharacterized protein n=1 Tax=Tetrahymena thermophila (strain SB210) TaxID=312017 RepID=Q245U7_TETTS|nr:hypothetical protein TTHERM_00245520 [Tetrahymena thermophila SB210]EAS03536.3 hypothetical protein TTHERM_00245520 [Tetrahymena thermophila SB210]|eukprot:XP_001023781.3 hypothetical protein TTHERM_00245520 [Tetrahymena thermophila SB210]
MSREDTIGLSFQQVYDAFQNDFHRTPQKKIVALKNRNTHLKSTVESNNNSHTFSNSNSNYSNYKSLDEEDQFICDEQELSLQQNQQFQVKTSSCSNNLVNNTAVFSYNQSHLNKEKMSPYDIEFDVLGNSLYETLQDCFTKTSTSSKLQQYGLQGNITSQFPCAVPIAARFGFESSLDNIYITEENFGESMEDEDKENRDPLENPVMAHQQFEVLEMNNNFVSRQLSEEDQLKSEIQEENDNEGESQHADLKNKCQQKEEVSPFHYQKAFSQKEADVNEDAFDIEENDQIHQCFNQKSAHNNKRQNVFEQNLMTPSNENHHKQSLECLQMDQDEVFYSQKNTEFDFNLASQISSNESKEKSIIYRQHNTKEVGTQNNQSEQSEHVVKFKNQLETIVDFEPNTTQYSDSTNGFQNLSNLYENNNDEGNKNVNFNSINNINNSINSNNNSIYQQTLLQSASQTNHTFRNQQVQQSSTNRTPLRDITSSSISSSKKNYQGIKKMLEFSSPMINNWDLKVSQKQKNLSSKQKNSGSSKKSKCTPAIFCR